MVDPSPFLGLLQGKVVSHVWRGYGSTMFVEFGDLVPGRPRRDGTIGNPTGELTLMIQWGWRIERERSIYGGSWSSERRWPTMFRKLIGATVTDAELFGRLPEISVGLSTGLHVVSFMTAEKQPEWAIICRQPALGSLCVKRGRLHIESPRS